MKLVNGRAGKSYSINAKVHIPIYHAFLPLIDGTLGRAQSSLALWGGKVLNGKVLLCKGRVKKG